MVTAGDWRRKLKRHPEKTLIVQPARRLRRSREDRVAGHIQFGSGCLQKELLRSRPLGRNGNSSGKEEKLWVGGIGTYFRFCCPRRRAQRALYNARRSESQDKAKRRGRKSMCEAERIEVSALLERYWSSRRPLKAPWQRLRPVLSGDGSYECGCRFSGRSRPLAATLRLSRR